MFSRIFTRLVRPSRGFRAFSSGRVYFSALTPFATAAALTVSDYELFHKRQLLIAEARNNEGFKKKFISKSAQYLPEIGIVPALDLLDNFRKEAAEEFTKHIDWKNISDIPSQVLVRIMDYEPRAAKVFLPHVLRNFTSVSSKARWMLMKQNPDAAYFFTPLAAQNIKELDYLEVKALFEYYPPSKEVLLPEVVSRITEISGSVLLVFVDEVESAPRVFLDKIVELDRQHISLLKVDFFSEILSTILSKYPEGIKLFKEKEE